MINHSYRCLSGKVGWQGCAHPYGMKHLIRMDFAKARKDARLLNYRPVFDALNDAIFACDEAKNKRFHSVFILHQTYHAGQGTCQHPTWHVDGRFDGDAPVYHLYCCGKEGSRTLFDTTPREIALPEHPFTSPKTRLEWMRRVLPYAIDSENTDDGEFIETPNDSVVRYSHDQFHKGRIAQQTQIRTLVRVCSSNTIRASTSIFEQRPSVD